MTRILTGTAVAMTLAMAFGCSQVPKAANTHDADIKAITEDVMRWQRDFNTRNLEKLLSHYADDSVMAIPGIPLAKSPEDRRAAFQQIIADPALNMTAHECPRVEVAKSGDYGYAQCSDTVTMTDAASGKPVSGKGGALEVYKKQADGTWKVLADMAFSELPPVPPAKPGK